MTAIVNPPIAITPGNTYQFTPPAGTTLGGPWQIVIENHSGYLITLIVEGTQRTLGPFTADKYYAATGNTLITAVVSDPPSGLLPVPAATFILTTWAAYPDTIPGQYPNGLAQSSFTQSVNTFLGTISNIAAAGGVGAVTVTPDSNFSTLAVMVTGAVPIASTDVLVVTGNQTGATYYDSSAVPEGSVTYVPILVNAAFDTSFVVKYTNNSGGTVNVQVFEVVNAGIIQVANGPTDPLFVTGPGGGPVFHNRVRLTAAGSQTLIPALSFETAYLYHLSMVVYTPNGSTTTFFVGQSGVVDATMLAGIPSDTKGVIQTEFGGLPLNMSFNSLKATLDVLTTAFIGEAIVTWAV